MPSQPLRLYQGGKKERKKEEDTFESPRKHNCQCCHSVLISMYQWRHKRGRYVWQKNQNVTSQPLILLLFTGKERTNMTAPRSTGSFGAQKVLPLYKCSYHLYAIRRKIPTYLLTLYAIWSVFTGCSNQREKFANIIINILFSPVVPILAHICFSFRLTCVFDSVPFQNVGSNVAAQTLYFVSELNRYNYVQLLFKNTRTSFGNTLGIHAFVRSQRQSDCFMTSGIKQTVPVSNIVQLKRGNTKATNKNIKLNTRHWQ